MSIFREICEKIGYEAAGGYNIVDFGGKHVYVDGADRIISIGDDKIVLGAGKKIITVTGENLAISDYEKGAVTIDGRISGENVE